MRLQPIHDEDVLDADRDSVERRAVGGLRVVVFERTGVGAEALLAPRFRYEGPDQALLSVDGSAYSAHVVIERNGTGREAIPQIGEADRFHRVRVGLRRNACLILPATIAG